MSLISEDILTQTTGLGKRRRPALWDFVLLMKPNIMLLVLLTGAASLVLQGSLIEQGWPSGVWRFALILMALLLVGGSANAFNMYFERGIDARMTRTREKRPLPRGKIKPSHALAFAIMIGLIGVALFSVVFNILSGFLALATILFYSFFYTLYLKPRTPYNIVIGGAAGSMAPIIAWAAVTGQIVFPPILLSMIIFLWTPPHFWSLALYARDDYELINYPMMPIARGDDFTRRQILIYATLLVLLSAACTAIGAGLIYAIIAAIAGAILIYKAASMTLAGSNDRARGMFTYSIVYLLVLFTGLIVDSALRF